VLLAPPTLLLVPATLLPPPVLVPALLVPAVLVPALLVPAALVPALLVPALLVPALLVPALLVPALLVPALLVAAALVPAVLVPAALVPAVLVPAALVPPDAPPVLDAREDTTKPEDEPTPPVLELDDEELDSPVVPVHAPANANSPTATTRVFMASLLVVVPVKSGFSLPTPTATRKRFRRHCVVALTVGVRVNVMGLPFMGFRGAPGGLWVPVLGSAVHKRGSAGVQRGYACRGCGGIRARRKGYAPRHCGVWSPQIGVRRWADVARV
jgi:hypothetical protein